MKITRLKKKITRNHQIQENHQKNHQEDEKSPDLVINHQRWQPWERVVRTNLKEIERLGWRRSVRSCVGLWRLGVQ